MMKKTPSRKPVATIVGAGSLASFLAPALARAGYRIAEIVSRSRRESRKRARRLARQVRARAVTPQTALLDADLLWFCVPDREIRAASEQLAAPVRRSGIRFAFHSSGALGIRELNALRKAGLAVASVHPLMTFVPGAQPLLTSVPFALEGDSAALSLARRIVRDLGGQSFTLHANRKAAYHAWATMTSPLLLAYLVTMEEAAHPAGLGRAEARRMSLPIVRQTLANYASLGSRNSFSGPFVRGDAATVKKHLRLLTNPKTRAVYVALARAALEGLPVKNKRELQRLLETRKVG